MTDIEKVTTGLELCTNITPDGCLMLCPYKDEQDETYSGFCEHVLKQDALELLKEQQWHDASKRPPREGRYLVWGLHEFTPDHCDEPNAYWQTRIANWSNRWGWDTKVKYWRELPEPTMDETH